MKATATAPSNIAFIKYWGRKDEALRLPENGSLSMNLSALQTTTTVEFSPDYTEDYIEINGTRESNESSRAVLHLDRVRALAKKKKKKKKNPSPGAPPLPPPAPGSAPLPGAAESPAGLDLSEKELSIL